MPRGTAVISYPGKRGTVWRIKYADADDRQVMETLGREADGWNETKAQRELGVRLKRVQHERWRKPTRETFATFAGRFRNEWMPTRNLKPSTRLDYEGSLRLHLEPFFGTMEVAAIEPRDLDRYMAIKQGTLSPKTVSNHLRLLSLMFNVARRWRLVTLNPVELVDGPRVRAGRAERPHRGRDRETPHSVRRARAHRERRRTAMVAAHPTARHRRPRHGTSPR